MDLSRAEFVEVQGFGSFQKLNIQRVSYAVGTTTNNISDVNKDWTCKDKDKDKAYKDQDKVKDLNLVLKESSRTRTRTRINITG